MRGVSKVKGRQLFEANFQKKDVGRLHKFFKKEEDAIDQRKKWEEKYGDTKVGVPSGKIKIDRRGQTIKNFFIIDYLPNDNKKVLVRNILTDEIKIMNLHGIVYGRSSGVPLSVSNYLSKKGENIGIRYRTDIKKWEAHISTGNKFTSLGTFKTKKEAIDARKEAEEKYFQPILDKYEKEQTNDEKN